MGGVTPEGEDFARFCVGFVIFIVCAAAIVGVVVAGVKIRWSPTLLRAAVRRHRAVNARAAGLMDLGYTQTVALHLASRALEDEAAANVREIESVMR